jgi:FtsH-binding integral membrane protein
MTKELTREQFEFRDKIYSFIIWTGLALILLWYILKSIGVINTQLWIELLPVGIAVFTAVVFVQQIRTDIRDLRTDIKGLKIAVGHLEKDVRFVKAQL